MDLINLLNFIKKLKPPTEEQIQKKVVELGEITRMKTLIFDLDETLIHSWVLGTGKNDDLNKDFEITLDSGLKYGISLRPYLSKCLSHLGQYYEMGVFTASEKHYADAILD